MRYRNGSTIIEVLIAATLISTAILAALSLGSSNQKQTDFSRYLNQATIYNNQALDWFRNLRTKMGWESFINELDLDTDTGTVSYCLNTLPEDTAGFAALSANLCGETEVIGATVFQREVTLTFSGAPVDTASVIMTTSWQGKAHQITTEGTLTKW